MINSFTYSSNFLQKILFYFKIKFEINIIERISFAVLMDKEDKIPKLILELLKKWILKKLTQSPEMSWYCVGESIEKTLGIKSESPIISNALYDLQIQIQTIRQLGQPNMKDIKSEKKESEKFHPMAKGIFGHSDCKKTGICQNCKEMGCSICLNITMSDLDFPLCIIQCDICFSKGMESE